MKLTKESLLKIISEEKRKISREKLRKKEKGTLNEAAMVSLQPIQRMERKEESLESKWMRIAGIDTSKLNEGEVVDMFSSDQKKDQAIERLARAMAARAEEMLDADGDGDDVAVHVDYKLFLTPSGIEGDGPLSLAEVVYKDYVSGKAGDQAHSLEEIIERISIDYFDEDIEDTLEALGDDRFDGTQDQMMRTKAKASQQDPEDIGRMELDFERFLQGIESGKIKELPTEES
jgi:hypothetical protein